MEAGVDEDKLFRCGNEEECEVVSCRTCKKKVSADALRYLPHSSWASLLNFFFFII